MSNRRQHLSERIARLTPVQRRSLAARLEPASSGALVAYVVSVGSDPTSPERLQAYLRHHLPNHMVPAAFVYVTQLPRTRGGKLDRRALADLSPATVPDVSPDEFVAPRNAIEEALAAIWCDVLGVDRVSIHDDFFEIGGDSLLSIRVLSRTGRRGIAVTPEQFFESPTIAAISRACSDGQSPIARAPVPQGQALGDVALSPIQHWFFERIRTDPHHWNQSVLLTVPPETTRSMFESAVRVLLAHHDGLRSRFVDTGSGRRQSMGFASDALPLRFIDLSNVDPRDREARIRAESLDEQQSLRLEDGKLARFAVFTCAPEPARLLIVIHHLLVDAFSWGILLEDLSTLLDQALEVRPLSLPPKTSSVIDWWTAVSEAQQQSTQDDVRPWLDMPEAPEIPVDHAGALEKNIVRSAASLSLVLGEHSAIAVERAATAWNVTARDVLLAAFLLAWRDHTGQQTLALDCEGHGRDVLTGGPDVSRTVGWFTTVFPVVFEIASRVDKTVERVGAVMGGVGRKGASHGMARYLGASDTLRKLLAQRARSQVLFNYLGRAADPLPQRSRLGHAPQNRGPERSLDGERAYLLELNGRSRTGRIEFDITYSTAFHHSETIDALARHFRTRLIEITGTVGSAEPAFELAGLDQDGLARAAALLDAVDDRQDDH